MFDDLESTQWAKEAIETLAANGIVNGKGNGKFDPDGKVSVDPATKQPLVPNPTIVGTMDPTPRYEVMTDENGNSIANCHKHNAEKHCFLSAKLFTHFTCRDSRCCRANCK